MFDLFGEIIATMKRNKMRTFLTGFAVAWGIFMLIVLLAAGNGLRNGVSSNFAGRAQNTVTLWPGWTSMPYKGYRADRAIRFDERTVEFVRNHFPEVGYLSGVFNYAPRSVSYGEEYGTWALQACMPDIFHINYMTIVKGRFLNEIDEITRRKVIVMGKAAADILFKDGEDPIGKTVVADGIAFQVVGIYDRPQAPSTNPPSYIPLSTGKMLYDRRGWGVRQIVFTVNGITTEDQATAFVERVRAGMGAYLGFDPTDTSAMYVNDSARNSIQTQKIFGFINAFLWVIGFASLMAGIVGVGNIMLVTVKERTREIGIRKAIGATPWSIVKMVIIEAVFVTTVAGYIGIMAGVGLTELIARGLSAAGTSAEGRMNMFMNPTVGLGVVFGALGLLIACGIVAGLIPSLRATRIRPIEAMRAD